MGIYFQDLLGLVILVALIAIPIVLWKRKQRFAAVGTGVIIISALVAVSIPGLKREKSEVVRAACINNLRVIQIAKAGWAKQNNKAPTDAPTWTDLVGEGKQLAEMPACSAGGKITIGAVNQKPSCSLADQGHVLAENPP